MRDCESYARLPRFMRGFRVLCASAANYAWISSFMDFYGDLCVLLRIYACLATIGLFRTAAMMIKEGNPLQCRITLGMK